MAGAGKTLMGEAVAGETGKPYVFVDPSAFTNMFMGVGILKVESLFRKLRKLALRYGGVMVFFDEAAALGNRGTLAQVGPVGGRAPGHRAQFRAAGCHGFSYLFDDPRWLRQECIAATPRCHLPFRPEAAAAAPGADGHPLPRRPLTAENRRLGTPPRADEDSHSQWGTPELDG